MPSNAVVKAKRTATESSLSEGRVEPDQVIVINDISMAKGGATAVALMLARELVKRRLRVFFVTGDDAPGRDDPENQGLTFLPLNGSHILAQTRLTAMRRGLYNREAAALVRDLVDRFDTPRTIYHVHGWSKILSPSIFAALKPVNPRVIVHAHDYFLSCPNGGYFDYQKEDACALKPLSAACLLRHCDKRSFQHKLWRSARLATLLRVGRPDAVARVLAVHDGMLPHLLQGQLSVDKLMTLRNPVTPWCNDRVVAENNTQFFYVGRLEPDKGIDLLAAAADLAGVPLTVIGQGVLSDWLQRTHPEVRQLGWKSREEIATLIRGARALVMPSRWRETFGLAPLEAMGSGLPLVVSKYSLISSETVEAGAGLSCNPFDRQAMAAALQRLSSDDQLVQRMSQRAQVAARAMAPTREAWLDELLGHYCDVLGGEIQAGARPRNAALTTKVAASHA